MQLNSLTILATLLAVKGAAADRLEVMTTCGIFGCNSASGSFITDFGRYYIDANEGCYRAHSVPHLEEFCIDWTNRRAHFRFGGQGKRCMRQVREVPFYCGSEECWNTYWDEVPCTWREIGAQDAQSTGSAANATATAMP
jgi:hypothetical protein